MDTYGAETDTLASTVCGGGGLCLHGKRLLQKLLHLRRDSSLFQIHEFQIQTIVQFVHNLKETVRKSQRRDQDDEENN